MPASRPGNLVTVLCEDHEKNRYKARNTSIYSANEFLHKLLSKFCIREKSGRWRQIEFKFSCRRQSPCSMLVTVGTSQPISFALHFFNL